MARQFVRNKMSNKYLPGMQKGKLYGRQKTRMNNSLKADTMFTAGESYARLWISSICSVSEVGEVRICQNYCSLTKSILNFPENNLKNDPDDDYT